MTSDSAPLFRPLELPCGVVLPNRIAKAAMSDSLGDGRGNPTATQMRLYERWAAGGIGLSIIGEVQGDPRHAEKPGNLVLGDLSDHTAFRELVRRGSADGTHLWAQLGHAGAMTHPPIGTPKGPSALDLPGLTSVALTATEIAALPDAFARTAQLARDLGFGGVEVHAAHGFLLSQFLSPLFNRRTDAHGGTIANRMRLLLDVIAAVRSAVGTRFPIGVKLNATDQLEGGLTPEDALEVVAALDSAGIDLIDVSGGTYFPGARAVSDAGGSGAYFLDFAQAARDRTDVPLMVTGGFKTRAAAIDAVTGGGADVVGLARVLVLDPDLPERWRGGGDFDPIFPRFPDPPEGGITAWYTMQLTALGEDREGPECDLSVAIAAYETRDTDRVTRWNERFSAVR
ncbi:NADH:flavin oxidoreductase/NADH oxidase family protein [Litoreibacter roseus]|uniref:Oxidoreductase n=1 Tax=Litoreibacter roseus TaxID=2601869 RepID=A0A6N6JKB0_9RHOB|nr:NADH:flavin oxidoreductase/NADH oxidase family protein [Litoreibacter roseus]GFE66761.1 oxidoreductase [Litoreibacter roseus]